MDFKRQIAFLKDYKKIVKKHRVMWDAAIKSERYVAAVKMELMELVKNQHVFNAETALDKYIKELDKVAKIVDDKKREEGKKKGKKSK